MINNQMGISRTQDSWLAPHTPKTNRNACVLVTLWCFRAHEVLQSHWNLFVGPSKSEKYTANIRMALYVLENTKSLKFATLRFPGLLRISRLIPQPSHRKLQKFLRLLDDLKKNQD